METQVLRWFQQVADGVTLTEISDLEMVSQPGVSRALSRLEREVGAALLQRTGRVLRLTRAGAAFKGHVDAMMHNLDDGLAAVEQLLDPERGVVTVAFEANLGTWLVPDLVRSFGREHPGVQFDLRAKADEHSLDVGSAVSVDLELSTLLRHHDGVEMRTLTSEPLRLIVPTDHRLAAVGECRLADVAAEPFVATRGSSALRTVFDELCRRAQASPRITLVADDLPTVRGYVAAGLGVGVVPTQWGDSADPASGRLRYLALADDAASRPVVLAWASGAGRMLDSARLFRDHILARARAGRLPTPVGPTSPVSGAPRAGGSDSRRPAPAR